MKEKKLAIANVIALLLVFLFNFLTGTGQINGMSQQDISAKFPTAITPAGFAFSIWGVIYTLVAIAIVLLLLRNREKEYNDTITAISYWFLLSSAANILWTISFSYLQIALSTVLIFVLLFSLTMVLKNLSKLTSPIKAVFPLAFGMYTGWVLIATVLNVSVTLVQYNWSGFGLNENIWANIILAVSIAIVFLVTYDTQNAIVPLPVAWAYYAIYVDKGFIITLLGIVVLVAISAYQLYRNKFKLQV